MFNLPNKLTSFKLDELINLVLDRIWGVNFSTLLLHSLILKYYYAAESKILIKIIYKWK